MITELQLLQCHASNLVLYNLKGPQKLFMKFLWGFSSMHIYEVDHFRLLYCITTAITSKSNWTFLKKGIIDNFNITPELVGPIFFSLAYFVSLKVPNYLKVYNTLRSRMKQKKRIQFWHIPIHSEMIIFVSFFVGIKQNKNGENAINLNLDCLAIIYFIIKIGVFNETKLTFN